MVQITIFMLIVCQVFIFAQDNKGKVRKEKLSFGEVWFVEKDDDTVGDEGELYNSEGIVEGSLYYAEGKKFYSNEFKNLLKADELDFIWTKSCEIIRPFLVNFDKKADTIKTQIEFDNVKAIWFHVMGYTFLNQIRFIVGEFNQYFELVNNLFNSDLVLLQIKFNSAIIDTSANIVTYMQIIGNKFERDLKIERSTINTRIYYEANTNTGLLSFNNTKFIKTTSFTDSEFRGNASFRNCQFKTKPEFNRIIFNDTLDFTSTFFEKGVDLRRCNLDSINKIILEKTDYPIGKLMIEWDQIRARDQFIISLDTVKSDKEDEFKRLVQIYEKLKYNYLALGDKNSSDNVSFELEQRKNELLGGFLHTIYGFTFGYGYRPMSYLVIVLIIMLLFALRLYRKYYETVFEIMDKGSEEEKPTIEKKDSLFGLPIYYQNFSGVKDGEKWEKLPVLTVLWHNVFMSTSLLIGLRFKREWIHKYDKKFLRTASFEWIFGIGLYIAFIIFVKGQRFEFLKGLFGV